MNKHDTVTQDPVLDFGAARERLTGVVRRTALEFNPGLSEKYRCEVYLKREDQQLVRSYKLRGAYNLISSLTAEQLSRGVVCASAGNHAQGVAFSCRKLNTRGVIFMPGITPRQKVSQTAKMVAANAAHLARLLKAEPYTG